MIYFRSAAVIPFDRLSRITLPSSCLIPIVEPNGGSGGRAGGGSGHHEIYGASFVVKGSGWGSIVSGCGVSTFWLQCLGRLVRSVLSLSSALAFTDRSRFRKRWPGCPRNCVIKLRNLAGHPSTSNATRRRKRHPRVLSVQSHVRLDVTCIVR